MLFEVADVKLTEVQSHVYTYGDVADSMSGVASAMEGAAASIQAAKAQEDALKCAKEVTPEAANAVWEMLEAHEFGPRGHDGKAEKDGGRGSTTERSGLGCGS